VDVLADLPSPVHLDGLSLQLRELQLDGRTRVGGRYLELQFELVPDQVVGGRDDSSPLGPFLVGLNFEPIVVLLLIGLDVGDDGLELLLEPVLPEGVSGPRVDREEGDIGGGLLD